MMTIGHDKVTLFVQQVEIRADLHPQALDDTEQHLGATCLVDREVEFAIGSQINLSSSAIGFDVVHLGDEIV